MSIRHAVESVKRARKINAQKRARQLKGLKNNLSFVIRCNQYQNELHNYVCIPKSATISITLTFVQRICNVAHTYTYTHCANVYYMRNTYHCATKLDINVKQVLALDGSILDVLEKSRRREVRAWTPLLCVRH